MANITEQTGDLFRAPANSILIRNNASLSIPPLYLCFVMTFVSSATIADLSSE